MAGEVWVLLAPDGAVKVTAVEIEALIERIKNNYRAPLLWLDLTDVYGVRHFVNAAHVKEIVFPKGSNG